ATAQGGKKMKVGVLGGQMLELLAIVNVLLAARAEHQPELVSLMTVTLRQQPVQHGTKRRDSGSRGNEHGVTEGRAQNEIAERSLKRDLRARVEIAEIVRHESILHAIQAEGDAAILGRWRRNRIRTGHLLAIGRRGLHREPLSGNEAEAGYSVHFEFEMLGKLGERDGAKHAGFERFELSHSFM